MTFQTSCQECRTNYEEDDRQPPCEEKDNCPINAVALRPENQQALDIYSKIKAFGSSLVFTLLNIQLNQFEAEELMHQLSVIDETIQAFRHQQAKEQEA